MIVSWKGTHRVEGALPTLLLNLFLLLVDEGLRLGIFGLQRFPVPGVLHDALKAYPLLLVHLEDLVQQQLHLVRQLQKR